MPISWKIMSLDDLLNYVPPGPEDREDAYNRANEIAYRETLEDYITAASATVLVVVLTLRVRLRHRREYEEIRYNFFNCCNAPDR
jgi:hypothetical protein